MRMHLCALLVLAAPSRVCAQEAAPAPAPQAIPAARRVTVTLGSGNAMGWLGAQAERYFGHERGSVFLGLGYTPDVDEGETSGLAGAAGVRGYTGGARHRGFLELGVSQIAVTTVGAPSTGPECSSAISTRRVTALRWPRRWAGLCAQSARVRHRVARTVARRDRPGVHLAVRPAVPVI
jgi:hypothetical protein